MLIIPTDAGDRELGQSFAFCFNSETAAGVPTAITSPVIRVRCVTNDGIDATSVALVPNYGSVTGLNKVVVDGTNAFYATGRDYVCELASGTVGGTSVAGKVCGYWSCQNQSDGIMLLRTIVVANGNVTAVDGVLPRQKFTVTIAGMDFTGRSDNPFENQNVIFQNGTCAGQGRLIRSSTPSGANLILELQESVSVSPLVGDSIAIIPQEGSAEHYYFKVTAEFGDDRQAYAVTWHRNGNPYSPDYGTPVSLTVFDPETGQTLISGEAMAGDGGRYVYVTTTPAKFVQQNHIPVISVSAYFGGRQITDSRPYPYAV